MQARLADYGAFIDIASENDGLAHISKLSVWLRSEKCSHAGVPSALSEAADRVRRAASSRTSRTLCPWARRSRRGCSARRPTRRRSPSLSSRRVLPAAGGGSRPDTSSRLPRMRPRASDLARLPLGADLMFPPLTCHLRSLAPSPRPRRRPTGRSRPPARSAMARRRPRRSSCRPSSATRHAIPAHMLLASLRSSAAAHAWPPHHLSNVHVSATPPRPHRLASRSNSLPKHPPVLPISPSLHSGLRARSPRCSASAPSSRWSRVSRPSSTSPRCLVRAR